MSNQVIAFFPLDQMRSAVESKGSMAVSRRANLEVGDEVWKMACTWESRGFAGFKRTAYRDDSGKVVRLG